MSSSIAQRSQRRPPANPRDALGGLRLVRLRDFEPAIPLPASKREPYCRRFATLFVDDTRTRHGGIGDVAYAVDTQGEPIALKTLRDRDGTEPSAGLEEAFRREYEAHLTLNGAQGFPRLYGYGTLDGTPSIVMEWISGFTLRDARRALAADGEGRVPTLTVARIGRALFELLVRMEQMGTGLVHRDLSPANVMIRTSHLSLEEQVREGVFDLCLIDLGSAETLETDTSTSLTSAVGVLRGATADYAPPEMLTRDLPHLARLRRSPKIDVYAAGSILYELMSGRLPFDLASDGFSIYRIKADTKPPRPRGIHATEPNLEHALSQEPEVAAEVAVALLDLASKPSPEDIRQCLMLVDDQLADLVLDCLEANQDRRPTADALRSALATFCSCHPENLRRALAGEQLLPCTADAAWYAGVSPLAMRRMIRSVGTGVSWGIWLVVVVATAVLVQGARASFGSLELSLGAPVVGLCLALPAVLALAARGGDTGTRRGFLRGTFVLVLSSLALAALTSSLSFDAATRTRALFSAIFASCSAGWCPLVLDYATTVVPGLIREARRALPPADPALVASTTSPLASPPEGQDATQDVSYEVPEDVSTD